MSPQETLQESCVTHTHAPYGPVLCQVTECKSHMILEDTSKRSENMDASCVTLNGLCHVTHNSCGIRPKKKDLWTYLVLKGVCHTPFFHMRKYGRVLCDSKWCMSHTILVGYVQGKKTDGRILY